MGARAGGAVGVMSASIVDLWSAYECLTDHQKRVVMDMYWHGYSQEECAETMGVSHQAISQTILAAQRRFEKKVSVRLAKKRRIPVVHVGTEDEGATQGNGQRSNNSKAPASSGPPASFCPQPDIYLGTPDRDAFVKELSWCAASPFLQLQGRGGYNERARLNRLRIARDRAAEIAERKAWQAAA